MAKLVTHAQRICRLPRNGFPHLLVSLISMVVFNSNESQGWPSVLVHDPSSMSAPEISAHGTTKRTSTFPPPPGGKLPSMAGQPMADQEPPVSTAPAITATSPQGPTQETLELYMNSGMTTPLNDDDLEYPLDYSSNEKALMKEYDFDSVNIVRQLAEAAIAELTPPAQFFEEIQELVSPQNRTRTEPDEKTPLDELPPLKLGGNWDSEQRQRLEKKYNVSSECTGPDSVTATRLGLMFPHFINFGQKPFAAPSNITVILPSGSSPSPTVESTADTASSWVYSNNRDVVEPVPPPPSGFQEYEIPAVLRRYEFGGLIPLKDPFYNTERHALIGLHLFALFGGELNDLVPFRTKCVLLRRRMQKCVLSDERRVRFLANNDISSGHGLALKPSLKSVYESVPMDFRTRIDWNLFEFAGRNHSRLSERPHIHGKVVVVGRV